MQLQEKSATQLQGQTGDYSQLVSLLVLFLHSPSPDIQHQLALFPPNLYLTLIANSKQHKDVRVACCVAMKSMVQQRQFFQPYFSGILQQLENIYITAEDSIMNGIQGSLQIVIQKILEMYLDDESKLKVFQTVIQRMNGNMDIRNCRLNIRMVKLCVMLVRSMDPNTLNNEVCVGGLIFYLKQLYYEKYKTQDSFNMAGRGIEILTNLMGQQKIGEKYLELYLQTQIQIVELIRQILVKLEEEGMEESESVPVAYIRNSKQIEALLQSIICLNTGGSLLAKNRKTNHLKREYTLLFSDYYLYHISMDFLVVCLNSIVNCSISELADESEDIIAQVLQLLERSVSYSDYANYFFNSTQVLVLKLFELIGIREAERQSLQNDPEHFAQISDDFCTNQQGQNLKTRAGSLLYTLCMSIDGNLTFVSQICLISMHYLQFQAITQLSLDIPVRAGVSKSEGMMKTLLQLWRKNPEELTETSILIFSSIYDLILKREEITKQTIQHLMSIHSIFKFKQKAISFFPPIIICRYIQLLSYFSFPNCLDPFLPLYSLKPVYAQTILKSLQTIIHYHNKKQEEMRMYVSHLSTSVLMISEKLTPLLEKIIVSRPEMIVCVKQRLIQKLVVWLLKYYQNQNMFGCNKISNLLCKVLENYPQYMVQTDQSGFNYDLMALTQYLTPLYKQLISSQRHPAEECIVDIAVAHISCLGTALDLQTARQFLLLGEKVVQNNNFVLNKCLQLISHLLCVPNMSKNMQKPEFMNLRKVHLEIAYELIPLVAKWIDCLQQQRDVDVWQLTYLSQIALVIVSNQRLVVASCNFTRLFSIYNTTKCHILRIKIYMVILILLKMNPDPTSQAQQFLQSKSLPQNIPPYEKNNFTIYLVRVVNLVQSVEYKAYLIKQILKLMYPNEKYRTFLNTYQQRLYCTRSGDFQTQIYALQTSKDVMHPLNCYSTDVYKVFKEMFNMMNAKDWDSIRKLLGETQSMVRDALIREVVGKQPRRILKVKKQ